LGRADEAATTLLALTEDPQVDPYVRRDAYNGLKALLGDEASA
jgi:hypothetical protein